MSYVKRSALEVSADLAALIENEILLGIDADAFWDGYSALLKDLVPVNRALYHSSLYYSVSSLVYSNTYSILLL